MRSFSRHIQKKHHNQVICILLVLLCGLFSSSNANSQAFDIYVSDAGNLSSPPYQILKFDENGENPDVFISQNLSWPQDILFLDDQNVVLISNLNSNRITRYGSANGNFIDDFATGIGGPTRMKIGPDGLLYVLQWTGNGRVKRYRLDGSFVDDFTNTGVAQSIGMDWDGNGNFYVASFQQASVRKFDSNGQDLGLFINANLQGPTNIWFDNAGDLLVADWSDVSVKRFDANGQFRGHFLLPLNRAEGVAYLPNGNILIGNGGTGALKMFDRTGQFVEDLVNAGAGGLRTPNAIVVREKASENNFTFNAGLNDAWYNPQTDGQGFYVTVYADLNLVTLAWFTYETTEPASDTPSLLGYAGQRWLTAFGQISGDSATMSIDITSGGLFDTATAIQHTAPVGSDGTITLTFSDCNSGTVEYNIPSVNRQGTVPIQRVALDNVALCEALQ